MFYEFYSYVDDHVYPDYFCCFSLRSSDIKDFYLSCGSGLLSFTSLLVYYIQFSNSVKGRKIIFLDLTESAGVDPRPEE